MTKPPKFVPARDTPWMARPTIRMREVDDIAQTRDPESDDQQSPTGGPAAARKQIRTNDKHKNVGAVSDLQREERIHSPKNRQECEPGEIMRGLVPRRLLEAVELGCDLGQCSHQQLPVYFCEERVDHQCYSHEEQPTPRDLLATAGELRLQE